MGEKKILTTWEAGRYCHVSPYTVRHWINTGQLDAYTTPGGHRRILRKNLDDFLRRHGMPVPSAFDEGRKRVLILGGDNDRRIVRDMANWTDDLAVTVAASAFEAGLLVASLKPDLFIVDADDGRWDAKEVFGAARRAACSPAMQMAAFTLDTSVETMEAFQRADVLRCFSKPVDRAELWRFLKSVFPLCDWKADFRTASRLPHR